MPVRNDYDRGFCPSGVPTGASSGTAWTSGALYAWAVRGDFPEAADTGAFQTTVEDMMVVLGFGLGS